MDLPFFSVKHQKYSPDGLCAFLVVNSVISAISFAYIIIFHLFYRLRVNREIHKPRQISVISLVTLPRLMTPPLAVNLKITVRTDLSLFRVKHQKYSPNGLCVFYGKSEKSR